MEGNGCSRGAVWIGGRWGSGRMGWTLVLEGEERVGEEGHGDFKLVTKVMDSLGRSRSDWESRKSFEASGEEDGEFGFGFRFRELGALFRIGLSCDYWQRDQPSPDSSTTLAILTSEINAMAICRTLYRLC